MHFCEANRLYCVEQTEVYVRGALSRVYATFKNIDEEATAAANELYGNLRSQPGYEGGPELSDLAEVAHDRGVETYLALDFLRHELTNSATAGLYHLWERLLKEFMCRELRWVVASKLNTKKIRQMDFKGLRETLEFLQVPVRQSVMDQLDVLRLVANVAKHGDGTSCEELKKKDPALFKHMFQEWWDVARADDMTIDEPRFVEFSDAVMSFWRSAPEYWGAKDAA